MRTLSRALAAAALLGLHAIAATAAVPHELNQADADAWLDGYLPYALAQADIAGAVVVIVKDGQVLTQRSYGYADVAARKRIDPATTMFRPGSISKLFTWTAVMQLVEQGKLNLDADVNRYLDFKIPPFQGQPLTMRNIMTHTSGFEEMIKGGIRFQGTVPPFAEVMKQQLPQRIFAPSTTPAYSNYATGLAGYIVERISGMSYEEYVERRIFQPLGMTHSTFRQPLPARLAPFMARGYPRASEDAKPYELISVPPAGSLAASAADMARFMVALLNQGAGLMKPETAQEMQDPSHVPLPGLNRMALGIYEQQVNGVSAIGHGGDLNFFHSYLWIIPSRNVGLYISMNSAGTHSANLSIRLALLDQFGDRYFPAATDPTPVELPTAKEHARMLAGSYFSSRGWFTNFLDVGNFMGQTRIGLDEDGRPQFDFPLDELPRQWIETAPFVWQEAYGHQRLGAKVENGEVVRWSIDAVSPFMVWDRVPWYRDAAWLKPLCLASLIVVALTALSWPAAALCRRRYGRPLAFNGRDLTAYRLVRVFCWLTLAVLGGWAFVLARLGDVNSTMDPDASIWLLEILGIVSFFGLLGSTLWTMLRGWPDARRWDSKLWGVALVISAFFLLWATVAFHLLSLGVKY